VRSALLCCDLDRSRFAGRGPMAIGMLVVDGDELWWPWRQTCRTAAALASLSGLLTACVSAQSFVVAVVAIQTRAADPMNYVANRPSIRVLLKRSEVGGSGAVCVVWRES
jgi:hypothetical protein